MSEEFDKSAGERNFFWRKDKMQHFQDYLNVTHDSIKNIPENYEEERRQKDYITGELRTLEKMIDNFISDLYT